MKVMILAAGAGKRLRPITESVPKVMVPVNGRPMLEYILDQIRDSGIHDVFVNLHYKPEQIMDHFGDGRNFGVHITYSHEPELQGTAGAVKKLESHFTETFLVYYGDNFVEIDIKQMIKAHGANKADVTIAVFPTQTPEMSGISQLDDRGRIIRFIEKPPRSLNVGNLANAGVYVVEPSILKKIPEDSPSDFGIDIFPSILKDHFRLFAYHLEGTVIGIDTPELLARLKKHLNAGTFRP